MRTVRRIAELDELMATRGPALLGLARLLAGGPHAGEDLLQAALERCVRSWGSIDGSVETYLRRVLYNLAVDRWRLRARRPEELRSVEPEPVADHADATALRRSLLAALAGLPSRQRAALVLRFFEDRTEAETAELLGCSVGTVKSTTSRALARLRETSGLRETDLTEGVAR